MVSYAAALRDVMSSALSPWIVAAVTSRIPATASEGERKQLLASARDAGTRGGDVLGAELDKLLGADIDAQQTTPLAIARKAVTFAAEVLRAAGVAPVARDRNAVEMYPGDIYDLTPGGFSDFGEEVQAAGINWGAAKAYLHLQRHQDES